MQAKPPSHALEEALEQALEPLLATVLSSFQRLNLSTTVLTRIRADLLSTAQAVLLPSFYFAKKLVEFEPSLPLTSSRLLANLSQFMTNDYLEAVAQHRLQARAAFLFDACQQMQKHRALMSQHFRGSYNTILDLTTLESETHNGCRSPLFFHFENENRLVFKPVDVSPFQIVAGALACIQSGGGALLPVTLPLTAHSGCAAFVPHEPNESLASSFFEGFGQLLACAYFLRMTDLHFENIIASGGRPVMIDVEMLAHLYGEDHHLEWTGLVGDPFLAALTGGGRLRMVSIRPTISPEQLEYHREIRLEQNRISIAHPRRTLAMNSRVLMDSFWETGSAFLRHKNSILEYIESSHSNAILRQLIRPTRYYTLLLARFFQPSVSPLQQHRLSLFRELVQSPQLISSPSHEILQQEYSDLTHGDVPYFHLRMHDPRLYHSQGRRTAHRLQQSPFDCLSRWLKRLSLGDLLHEHGRLQQLIRDTSSHME